ncbi:MAG: DUF975 family protein [Lachnospiraceae bacterium]|nr:DUF975 family protein [Lachnospiraceae bacterium]
MFDRVMIKQNAKAAISARYGLAVAGMLLGGLLSGAFTGMSSGLNSMTQILVQAGMVGPVTTIFIFSFLCSIFGIICSCIFGAGTAFFSYHMYTNQNPEIADLFAPFKNKQFWHVIGGMLLMSLKIWLWSLLLIIPGIVKAYEYSMIPYLLLDRPELSVSECFRVSKEMTYGHKFDLFVLELSFIGWALLSILTCGILFMLYVSPYISIANAGAYAELKRMKYGDTTQTYGQDGGQYNGQVDGQFGGQYNGQVGGQVDGQYNGQFDGQFGGQVDTQSDRDTDVD